MILKVCLFFIVAVLSLCGCGSSRRLAQNSDKEMHEKTKIIKETSFVTDTITIEIPVQSTERKTTDSVSHLENDFAISDACINPDGSLFHSLKSRRQKRNIEIQKPIERRDSIIYKTVTERATITKEVPRSLTWFGRLQKIVFWLVALYLFIKIIQKRHFR